MLCLLHTTNQPGKQASRNFAVPHIKINVLGSLPGEISVFMLACLHDCLVRLLVRRYLHAFAKQKIIGASLSESKL